jgi:hypothetical protein
MSEIKHFLSEVKGIKSCRISERLFEILASVLPYITLVLPTLTYRTNRSGINVQKLGYFRVGYIWLRYTR